MRNPVEHQRWDVFTKIVNGESQMIDMAQNFEKITGKHLRKRLKETFSFEFCEVFKNKVFIEHLWWLLLKILNTPLKYIYFMLMLVSVSAIYTNTNVVQKLIHSWF